MASEVDIANMALGNIGVSRSIESLEEESEDARQCLRWYALVRDECLRKVTWQFACAFAKLASLTNTSSEWGYMYAKPADALRIVAVGPEGVIVRPMQAVAKSPFALVGSSIMTDVETAYTYYVRRVTDAEEYPPEFAVWMSWRLALRIGRGLGADNAALQSAAAEERSAFRDAVVGIQNERRADLPTDPDSLAYRW